MSRKQQASLGQVWKDFLLYNKGERRSIITLSLLLLLSSLFFLLMPAMFPPEPLDIQIKEWPDEAIAHPENGKNYFANDEDVAYKTDAHEEVSISKIKVKQPFDPNQVTYEELIAMGLPTKLCKTWIKYISKGARFRDASDLRKLFGMREEIYLLLEPYLSIKQIAKESTTNKVYTDFSADKKTKKVLLIDLNLADTSQLKQLPLIGSGRAKSIAKYRDLLGGFVAVNQLKEVYGLNDSIYNAIKTFVYVSPDYHPKRLSVNKLTDKELAKHPYFRGIATLIFNYRQAHGALRSAADFEKIYGLDVQQIQRLSPYIDFEMN